MLRRMTGALVVLAAAVGPAPAQIALTQVASGFTSPLVLTGAPNDPNPNRAFVLERNGLVRTLDFVTGGVATPGSTFLNLQQSLNMTGGGTLLTDGEQGLLGMAFSPTYSAAGNGFLYVNYVGSTTPSTSGGETRIDRFTVTGGVLNPMSRQNIITIDQPDGLTNHKGGWLGFHPNSQHLYIATGDGGGGGDPFNNGQNPATLLGKLLRITPNTTAPGYTIPADNPNFGAGSRPELFSIGLRNPFRASFDNAAVGNPARGNLYIGDVGQSAREEVDFIAAASPGGQNFGWDIREGRSGGSLPGSTEPIYDYTRANGDATVIGGYVYRGGDILDGTQSLDGTYIFGDYISGRIFSFRYTGTDIPTNGATNRAEANSQALLGQFNLVAFGQDNLNRMYVLGQSGQIYRITGQPIPEPGTLALCGGTVIGGWLWRRKRGSKSNP